MIWTENQQQHLRELGAGPGVLERLFGDARERNQAYQEVERELANREKAKLLDFLAHEMRPRLVGLQRELEEYLKGEGFFQVVTPTVIRRAALEKMTIGPGHDLYDQIFSLDAKRCLRPMLAPNLYEIMAALEKTAPRPYSFFEIGSCFRKDSQGAQHQNEFTMLNLVEVGLPLEEREERLRYLGRGVAQAAGIDEVEFSLESSEVYGSTIDVVSPGGEVEIASGAMGPHPLDPPWRVTETWVGLGFGLERLILVAEGGGSISRWARSTTYVGGVTLNL